MDKLDLLTLEAEMLCEVLDDALKFHEEDKGISALCYLSEIIHKKFREIRALF